MSTTSAAQLMPGDTIHDGGRWREIEDVTDDTCHPGGCVQIQLVGDFPGDTIHYRRAGSVVVREAS